MNLKKGLLIVVDGPSVSGKDSLIWALARKIMDMGLYPYVFSEELTDPRRQEILQARERGKMRGGSGERESGRGLSGRSL